MPAYAIKPYRPGFEADQASIGQTAAYQWAWPYAFSLADLRRQQAQPDFDPQTRYYCFLGQEMVGYLFTQVSPGGAGEKDSAYLDLPRMRPGHEAAAAPLLEHALAGLRQRGVVRVTGRLTTMCPDDIRLAEQMGFTISDWGHKVYYRWPMAQGRLDVAGGEAEDIDPVRDLDTCSRVAAHWYQRPAAWCRAQLSAWHEAEIISHNGVWDGGQLVAAGLAAPNDVRPATAGIFYIHTPDESKLEPLLAALVNRCLVYGVDDLIADLVNLHRAYEPVYQALGFQKVAEWARWEKQLD